MVMKKIEKAAESVRSTASKSPSSVEIQKQPLKI